MDDYKFAIIFNDTTNKTIEFYGDSKSDDLHIACLLEAARQMYPDEEIFNQLNIRHLPITAIYFLTELGNIVVMNSTKFSEKELAKYGKTAEIILPEEISSKQITALKELMNNIDNYSIEVDTNLGIKDGMVRLNSHTGLKNEEFDKIMDIIGEECHLVKKAR